MPSPGDALRCHRSRTIGKDKIRFGSTCPVVDEALENLDQNHAEPKGRERLVPREAGGNRPAWGELVPFDNLFVRQPISARLTATDAAGRELRAEGECGQRRPQPRPLGTRDGGAWGENYDVWSAHARLAAGRPKL